MTTRTGERTVTDKDVEQNDERDYGPGPWWEDLGAWGAVGLIVFGGLAAVWVFFRLPGTPQEMAMGYYQAAKVVAIGLVIAGTALLGRRRTGADATEKTDEAAGGAAGGVADEAAGGVADEAAGEAERA
ncbi:hypothetical protein ACFVXC_06360 [Streptomyces sp. NPDC058257]|uniref:hypothetical protein n=1 Tax=Streptomyces sp. NPDC058257 TaxID=3346409 RepID=UPI0036E481B3